VQFLNKEGSTTNDKGQTIAGKTKPWVITREISMKSGEIFNRRNLEDDIKRLYGTGLFSDVKVTLKPDGSDPGRITIVLGIVEQATGSLSGGLGYSQSQGVFGQVQVQDSNFLGRAWDVATSFTYGQFGGLADVTFTDPWIKGDPFRTALRVKGFISRDVPQIFQSQDSGNIYTASDFYEAPGTKVAYNINNNNNPLGKVYGNVQEAQNDAPDYSWYDFDGNSVVIQRVGGNIQVVRPLNGGNPFNRAPWNVVVGLSAQQVKPINFSGDSMPYGVSTNAFTNDYAAGAQNNGIICISYNCADTNQLLGVRFAATMNTLNDPRNPTKGNFLSIGTEQFISVGPDSPTFNRVRAGFTHYIPVNWLKFYKGCRPKAGEKADCKQALAFQFTAGANIGSLPTYEAFCIGGGNSVRGYYDCDLGVGRSFGEATVEYRFPLFSIVSGELFVDGGSAFGTQDNVPGQPGNLLNKPGSGFSVGTGLIVTTPVGPLRLEVASRDFTGDWRFNLGVAGSSSDPLAFRLQPRPYPGRARRARGGGAPQRRLLPGAPPALVARGLLGGLAGFPARGPSAPLPEPGGGHPPLHLPAARFAAPGHGGASSRRVGRHGRQPGGALAGGGGDSLARWFRPPLGGGHRRGRPAPPRTALALPADGAACSPAGRELRRGAPLPVPAAGRSRRLPPGRHRPADLQPGPHAGRLRGGVGARANVRLPGAGGATAGQWPDPRRRPGECPGVRWRALAQPPLALSGGTGAP